MYTFFFILYLNKVGKKPKGRGSTKPGKDEARPGKGAQAVPGDCFSILI